MSEKRIVRPTLLSWSRSLFLAICLVSAWRYFAWPDARWSVRFDGGERHTVARVVDGDTLELEGGDRVRLIGVDTPEFAAGGAEPFAVEAREFVQQMVDGQEVTLQFDRERFDKYRRVLAFVYVDGVLLNEALVRAGLGRAMVQFAYSTRMKKRLLMAQEEAQALRRGLWAAGHSAHTGRVD